MRLILLRQPSSANETFGMMTVNGLYECFTLENTHKIIPIGNYELELYPSPKFHMLVPLLRNVPNRNFIEIHPANYYHQLEGCIAVGKLIDTNMLVQSRKSFDRLLIKLRDSNESHAITILNPL